MKMRVKGILQTIHQVGPHLILELVLVGEYDKDMGYIFERFKEMDEGELYAVLEVDDD